jgi:hypothetical protein
VKQLNEYLSRDDRSGLTQSDASVLPHLAEAVAGQHLDDLGSFELLAEDQRKVFNEIREDLREAPADDEWAT